jgi:hypothetical protein
MNEIAEMSRSEYFAQNKDIIRETIFKDAYDPKGAKQQECFRGRVGCSHMVESRFIIIPTRSYYYDIPSSVKIDPAGCPDARAQLVRARDKLMERLELIFNRSIIFTSSSLANEKEEAKWVYGPIGEWLESNRDKDGRYNAIAECMLQLISNGEINPNKKFIIKSSEPQIEFIPKDHPKNGTTAVQEEFIRGAIGSLEFMRQMIRYGSFKHIDKEILVISGWLNDSESTLRHLPKELILRVLSPVYS